MTYHHQEDGDRGLVAKDDDEEEIVVHPDNNDGGDVPEEAPSQRLEEEELKVQPLTTPRKDDDDLEKRIPVLLDRLSMLQQVDFEVEFPQDVYSILYLAPWHSFAFWYSLSVFFLQISVLSLAWMDMVFDAPGRANDNNPLNIPPTATTQVFIAQFLALFIAVLSQDDVTVSLMMISISLSGEEYAQHQSTLLQVKYPNAAQSWQFWLANLLRLIEGLITIMVSFLFIIQSNAVLEIFLNFAAIEFVSELDNLGHRLAQEGYFGYSLQTLARRMRGETIPIKKARNPVVDYVNRSFLLVIIAVMFAFSGVVTHRQRNGYYIQKEHCSVLEVTFGDDHYSLPPHARFNTVRNNDGILFVANSTRVLPVGMNPSDPPDLLYSFFSGKYEADFHNKAGLSNSRPVYYEASKNAQIPSRSRDDSTVGFFYYCEGENAWVWSLRALVDTGAVPQETLDRCKYGWLLRSPITRAVTLEEVPTHGWRIWKGVLDEASDLSFRCMECRTDLDCGLNRGICGIIDQQCHCHDYAAGTFCNRNYDCDILMIVQQGKQEPHGPFYSRKGFQAYGRPYYLRLRPDDGLSEYIFYTGRRWVKYNGRALDEIEERKSFEMHAYWFSSLLSQNFWYSERTEKYLPTGSLKWYSVDNETRSEGSYGPYGREIAVNARVECLSVDCKLNSRICGNFGKCQTGQFLTLGDQFVPKSLRNSEELAVGGKCVCDPANYGHFCEFRYDDGTMTANSTKDEL